MTAQQAGTPLPSGRVVRWQPPADAGGNEPESRHSWRDNVVRRQDFQAAHPDVIWPSHELNAPWAAYVPAPDGTLLEVADNAELGGLLDKLALAVAHRDAERGRTP